MQFSELSDDEKKQIVNVINIVRSLPENVSNPTLHVLGDDLALFENFLKIHDVYKQYFAIAQELANLESKDVVTLQTYQKIIQNVINKYAQLKGVLSMPGLYPNITRLSQIEKDISIHIYAKKKAKGDDFGQLLRAWSTGIRIRTVRI